MAEHSTLTGASLHEPKGVAAASAGQIYVADGAGSGAWQKVGTSEIDTSEIPGVNKFYITLNWDTLETAKTRYVPIPRNANLVKILTALDEVIDGADAVFTFFNGKAGSAIGTSTITITQSGSATGDVDTSSPTTNNSFSADDVLEIILDGGPTSTGEANMILEFEAD